MPPAQATHQSTSRTPLELRRTWSSDSRGRPVHLSHFAVWEAFSSTVAAYSQRSKANYHDLLNSVSGSANGNRSAGREHEPGQRLECAKKPLPERDHPLVGQDSRLVPQWSANTAGSKERRQAPLPKRQPPGLPRWASSDWQAVLGSHGMPHAIVTSGRLWEQVGLTAAAILHPSAIDVPRCCTQS